MAITINTNIASLNSQANLGKATSMLQGSLSRLSSGSRINSAKDDAAGLAISQRLGAQINGNNVAIRNANDAISVTATAEGSLQESTNILLRLRDLAVQSSSDTNTASDRKALQEEADQLFKEIDRIASSTQFNTRNLLDGSFGTASIQVGANKGQTIDVSLKSATTKALNLNGYSNTGDLNSGRVTANADLDGTSFVLNGVTVTADNSLDDYTVGGTGDGALLEAADMARTVNRFTGQTGVTAQAYNTVTGGAGASGLVDSTTFTVTVGQGGAAQSLSRNATSLSDLSDLINKEIGGVTSSINSKGQLVLANDTGQDITIAGGTAAGLEDITYKGFVSMSSADGSKIEVGVDPSLSQAAQNTQKATLKDMGLNVSTGSDKMTGGAVDANAVADTDLITINGVRMGASADSSAASKAAAINSISSQSGVTASATTTAVVQLDMTANGLGALGATDFSINGTDVDLTAATDLDDVVTAINGAGLQGVVATADEDGNLVLKSDSGFDITVGNGSGGNSNAAAFATAIVGDNGTVAVGAAVKGSLNLTNASGGDIVIGSDATTLAARDAAMDKLGVSTTGGSTEALGTGLNLTSRSGANVALERIDSALENIASQRSQIGAIQNRLTSAITNLGTSVVNQSAARSQILDTDFASETANLTKAQILQQASSSILAQANQTSQVALSLLR